MKYHHLIILIILLAAFLRLYKLDQNPPSPYVEEVALGYDAYSILKTGRDHHGNFMPLVAFQSYGDYKPSLYFYTLVPVVAIFDLNVFSVRLPSALAGIATVGLAYLIAKELIGKKKELIALLTASFLAILPWHVLVSRIGFEANLGLMLVGLGVWLFLKGINKAKLVWFIFSSLSFGLSLYAYHGDRVFTPILVFCLLFYFIRQLILKKRMIIIFGILFLLSLLPIGLKAGNPTVGQRFAQTSAFTDLGPIIKSNIAISQDHYSYISRIIHHRWRYYSEIFIRNYFSHFNPQFLFFSGDSNLRHSVQLVGQLYWLQLPLIIAGVYFIFRKKFWQFSLVLLWLLTAPVPASLTVAAPHALRALPMVIPISILSAFGLYYLAGLLKSYKFILFSIVILIAGYEAGRFWHYYWNFYPIYSSQEWNYGYKELISYINTAKDDYDQIIITREWGRPVMYYWFYSKTDPKIVQAWNNISLKDQGEYLQFENLYFGNYPIISGKQLQVSLNPMAEGTLAREIKNIDNKTIFYIYGK